MAHLDDGLRATLLSETRERYKVEHDRFNQAFTRAGVYLGVAGVMATALYRFIDKPPAHQSTFLYAAYFTFLCLTISLTCVGAILVIWAIIGRSMDYGVRPSGWWQHALRTQDVVERNAAGAAQPNVPTFVRVVIEE